MKKNKNIKYLVLIILVSLIITASIELLANRQLLTKNESYQPGVVETNDIEKDGKWYKTTSKDAYIVLKLEDNYLNKIFYQYKAKDNFKWVININGEKLEQASTSLIDVAEREIKSSSKEEEIRIDFKAKNIEFKDITINNKIDINYSRALIIFLTLIGIATIIIYKDYFFHHLDKTFLLISLLSGVIMITILPKVVYFSWDDQIHFRRSYTFLSSETAKVPSTILKQRAIHSGYIKTKTEEKAYYDSLTEIQNDQEWQDYSVNNYSPKYNMIVYLPFTIGLKTGHLLNLSYSTSIMLAKLLNFICYVGIVFFAIKIATKLKKIIFLISLFVTNIFISAQFSYDPTIIACLILATSLFYRMLEDEKINKKYLLAFVLSVIWASLPKAIYAPMLLLLVFIPNKKFDNKKQAIKFKTVIIVATLLLMATFVLPTLTGSMGSDPRGGDTSVGEQLKLILENPLRYAKTVTKYFLGNSEGLIIGQVMSLVYINDYIEMVTPAIAIINFILLLYILFTEKVSKRVISNKIKVICALGVIGISVLIVTSMYLSFTPIGSTEIMGVQTRYFTPILLLGLLVLIPTTTQKITKQENNNILILLVPFISLMLVNLIIAHYGTILL